MLRSLVGSEMCIRDSAWTTQAIPEITLEDPGEFSFDSAAPAYVAPTALGAAPEIAEGTALPGDQPIADANLSKTETLAKGTVSPLPTDWATWLARGTKSLADFANVDDVEQFEQELNRVQGALDGARLEMEENGSTRDRFIAYTARMNSLIQGGLANIQAEQGKHCLLYTSPSPRDS